MKKILFLFGELNDLDVDWLIKHGCQKIIREGEVLIQQGQANDWLHIVMEGSFSITVAGASEPLNVVGAGEVVGEVSFIDSRLPSSTVRATTNGRVFCIAVEVLANKLRHEPGFAARFYRALAMFLSHRFRQLTLRVGHQQRGPDKSVPDELDGQVLDGLYLAGKRFQRVLQALSARDAGRKD